MKGRIKGVLEFYATIGVPILYGVNLWLIASERSEVAIFISGIGLFVALLGIILWSVSYLNLGKAFGVLPRKQRRVRRGIYRFLRHPMYWGIGLTFGGLALANGSRWGMGFLILLLVPVLIFRAKLEERRLEA